MPATATDTAGKWGYLALWKEKRAKVWTNAGIHAAKEEAARMMQVKPNQRRMIVILPCIRPDGSEIVHTPDF